MRGENRIFFPPAELVVRTGGTLHGVLVVDLPESGALKQADLRRRGRA